MADQTGAVTTENRLQTPQSRDNDANSRIVGVRFPESGRVSYFDVGAIAIEVGDWVVVDTSGRPQTGRVVIAPHQVRLNMLAEDSRPIVRRLSDQDVEQMERLEQGGPRDAARLVGGLGRFGRNHGCLSRENEQYQRVKALLPRLGQRVDTPRGPGIVIALQVVKERVIVRLDADDAAHEFTPADLGMEWPEPMMPS